MTDTHTSNLGALMALARELMAKAAEQENEKTLNVLLSLTMALPVLGGEPDAATKRFDKHAAKFEKILLSEGIPEVEAKKALQLFTENVLTALMLAVASACADDQVQENLAAEFREVLEGAARELEKS